MPNYEIRLPWIEPFPDWHQNGACKGIGVDLFFADHLVDSARSICADCAVQPECLAWALNQGSTLHGVWGGTTEDDRRRLRRRGAA